jgi:cytochrome P450
MTDEPTIDGGDDPRDAVRRLNELAALSPTAVDPDTGIVFVLHHADVERLAHDPALHGMGLTVFDFLGIDDGPLRRWYSSLMFSQEGEEHGRTRRLVARAFTPRSVERLRAETEAMVAAAYDEIDAASGGDLVAALARIPMRVMCALLGVPHEDLGDFQRWGDALSPAFALMDETQQADATMAIVELLDYVGDLVSAREHLAGDDLLTALLQTESDGDRLTRGETVDIVANLLVAGHDTTGSQIGCTLFALLTHPDAADRLRNDPSLVPSAVSETMRFEPSIIGMPRTVTAPLVVGGIERTPGTMLVLCLASANRDAQVWKDPDDLRIDRFVPDTAPRLLSFGTGPHFCLGAHMARMTLEEITRRFAARPYALVPDADAVPWRQVLGRSPATLPVRTP